MSNFYKYFPSRRILFPRKSALSAHRVRIFFSSFFIFYRRIPRERVENGTGRGNRRTERLTSTGGFRTFIRIVVKNIINYLFIRLLYTGACGPADNKLLRRPSCGSHYSTRPREFFSLREKKKNRITKTKRLRRLLRLVVTISSRGSANEDRQRRHWCAGIVPELCSPILIPILWTKPIVFSFPQTWFPIRVLHKSSALMPRICIKSVNIWRYYYSLLLN